MSKSNLAELVASRICHDLISPIGAISNGVELMGMMDGMQQEVQLVSESAQNASGRVRMFRVAFGKADPSEQMSSAEIKSIFKDLVGDRLHIHWNASGGFSRSSVKLAFLAILCLEKALPRGGAIFITGEGNWKIIAEGDVIMVDEALWAPLSQGMSPDELTGTTVTFGLLPMALKTYQKQMDIQFFENQISIDLLG